MLELRHLRALRAIAEHGSLTAAAESLDQTQSALSHLVAELERRGGSPLLDRSRRPLRLTAAGERIRRCAEAVLPLMTETEADLAALQRDGDARLFLATECYGCLEWLLPAMDAFRAERPEVELDLRLGGGFDRLGDLVEGAVDLVVTPDTPRRRGIHYLPLFAYDMVLVCAPGHPLAARPHIRPRDLAGETLVTYPVSTCRLDLYARFLEPAGIQPAGRVTSELTAVIEQKVASGTGVAALPAWTVSTGVTAGRVVTRPLGAKGLRSRLHAALRRDDDEQGKRFAVIARRTAKRSLPDIDLRAVEGHK